MRYKISSAINIIIAVFLLIAVRTFCRPCHGVMEMPCEHSTKIAGIVLLGVIAVCIIRGLINNRLVQRGGSVLIIIGGILLILTPVFGKCQVASMSCCMKTFPALKLGGILIIAFTAVFAVIGTVNEYLRSESHAHTV